MTHPRQDIRTAIVTALSGHTASGTRVFPTRAVPWRSVELPGIAVYALQESVESQQTAPRSLKRTLEIEIVGSVSATANVDNALDDLALEIERAMHGDPTLGGKASDSVLSNTEIAIEVEGNKPIGQISLLYTVTYYTSAPEAVDVPLVDLLTVDVKTQVTPTADPTEDLLEF